MPEPLSGLVLAGGESSRLGCDKAAVTFGGRTLLEIIVDRLSAVCDEVMVACGRGPAPGWLALPVRFVRDPLPGEGPLAGLDAGLRAARRRFVLVVACDMPFLNTRVLLHMAALPRRYQALVPWLGGRWHPTHAIYSRSCLPLVESLLAQGENSLSELLARLRVRELLEHEVRRYDPDGLTIFNVNHPWDLARARELWNRRQGEALANPRRRAAG